jgi:hypothetical protein
VCPFKSKSKSVMGTILAILCMGVLICKADAQQGVSGTLTAGTGSTAYLQFLGAPNNPQIACALNAGADCSILFTPMGAGGLNFQNGHGGNSMQIIGTSVSPGDTLQYVPNSAGPAVFIASIGATFIGTGSGTSLTVAPVSGVIHPGSASTASITGTGVPTSTYIVSQVSGTAGGAGAYVTNNPTTSSGASITATSTTMDVTGTTSGTIAVGQNDSGIGIASGTMLSALIGGTGGVGTYTVSPAQYAPSTSVTALGSTVTLQTSNNALITLKPSLALTGPISFNNNGIFATNQQKFQSVFNVTGIDTDIAQQNAGIFNINASFVNSTSFASAPPIMSITARELGTGYARALIGLQVFTNLSSSQTAPSAWAATTTYANGATVSDAAAAFWQTFTGGTSGSTEPSLSGCPSPCTDGTVVWTYTGTSVAGAAMVIAAQTYGQMNQNQGGTAAGLIGVGWGFLNGIIVGASGTFMQGAIAQETDINVSPTGTAAPGSVTGIGIYTQAAGQGRFYDASLSIEGNPGAYKKDGITFGTLLDPNSGVGLAVYDIRFGFTWQAGAGLIDCLHCDFAGTQSVLGNDAPFILKSPYFDLLTTGDMRLGYGLVHVTSSGFTLDVSNYTLTSNTTFSGGTGWMPGEEACDTLGNCGVVTQISGVPTFVAVYTNNFIPPAAVPGAAVTWHAIMVGAPSATGGTALGTNFTTTESYTQASNPTIGIGGTTATAINLGNGGSTTTITGVLRGAAGTFTANGTTGTTMTSLGPAGVHATVQEWFTVTDASGALRYIPTY